MPPRETPYWWTTVDADFEAPVPAPSLEWPARADVAILGGGYTGLSAARTLARGGARVVVFERHALGWGASSRNGGQVLTGLKLGPAALIRRVGRSRARDLYGVSRDALAYLETLIGEEAIDCDYRRCGHLEGAAKPAHFEHFGRTAELLEAEFGHRVRLLPRADQRSEIGSDLYHGVLIDERSGALNPARYVLGLARAAASAGAELRDGIAVARVVEEAAGFRLETPAGSLHAGRVLVATNGYTDAAAPSLRRRVVPVGSYIIATAPLAPELAARLLPTGRVVFDSRHFLHYFRLSEDLRLLFGGRARFTPSTPSSTRSAARVLRSDMVRVFPELAGVEIEFAWSGNVCFTPDKLPRAGSLHGLHHALAYGGHGVALSTFLGHRVALSLLGRAGAVPFSDLPFPFIPFYEGRPWFLPLAGAWYKLLDWWG